jgi:hypothetical protein
MTRTKTTAAVAAILGLAVVATSITTTPAEAGSKKKAFVGGLIVGTIAGATLASPRYGHGHVVVRRGPAMTPAGVTVAHARWCANRFRSYDWNTNTYVNRHGQVRWC